MTVLISCSSCSYERNRHVEDVVRAAEVRFRTQLNERKFHEIYEGADVQFRQRISEAEAIRQFEDVVNQLGQVDTSASVFIDETVGKAIRRRMNLGEIVPYSSLLGGVSAIGVEDSSWMVTNDEARLADFHYKFLCKKPCTIAFGQK